MPIVRLLSPCRHHVARSVLGALIVLAGCAATDPLPVNHPFNRAYGMVSGKDSKAKPLQPTGRRTGNGYQQFATSTRPDGADEQKRWRLAFFHACYDAGGQQVQQYCASKSNPDVVLFAYKLAYGYGSTTEVTYFEPTSATRTPEFDSIVRESGYLTSEERTRQQIAVEDRAIRSHLEESINAAYQRERSRQTMPALQVRGLSVCKDVGSVRYLASVEDFTDEKLKLLISAARYVGSPSLAPSGFQQQTIWSTAERWVKCEQRLR